MTFLKLSKKVKKIVMKNGLEKKQIVIVKDTLITQSLLAIQELEVLINPLFLHVYNIETQYFTIRQLKENLSLSEVVLSKYSEEIQPFHFGGSRQ